MLQHINKKKNDPFKKTKGNKKPIEFGREKNAFFPAYFYEHINWLSIYSIKSEIHHTD